MQDDGWQLQDAKARFSEFIDKALNEGPQTVTRHGKPVAVLVSLDTWQRLESEGPTLKAWLRAAPLEGVDLSRSRSRARRKDLP
jgi:prevent-host-death family protein